MNSLERKPMNSLRYRASTVALACLFIVGCGEVPRPELNRVSPSSTLAGQLVTIRGSNLGANPQGNQLLIHGKPVKQIISWTPFKITAYVPEGLKGKGEVQAKIGALSTNSLNLEIVEPVLKLL